MDILYIISTKVRHLFENRLQIEDFIYQPLFPAFISIVFTFINAKLFHLNTVVESVAGSIFLILLGYKYLSEINNFIKDKKSKILFSLLTAFIIFGLHKWEASFTSFFSFGVFFILAICFFNYFFIVKYIDKNFITKKHLFPLFIFSNLLVISEAPAYIFSYILSVVILLILVRHFKIIELDKNKWLKVLLSMLLLLFATLLTTTLLSQNPDFNHGASKFSITAFLKSFSENPLWFIKFYLLATTGPFLGEANDYFTVRVLAGFTILTAYSLAIYHVIKSKDKRLLIPLALIFYNLISYGFITMSRYVFNIIEYGASSRYTAFNLSGVLGLVTILFFYVLEEKRRSSRSIGYIFLILILSGYLYVDIKQYIISPHRTSSFKETKASLLTEDNLSILQANKTVSLNAIEVLKKYNLNVYYTAANKKSKETVNSNDLEKIVFEVGRPSFEEITKIGFYKSEGAIAWTNGNALIQFDDLVNVRDSVTVELNTYMPPICKMVTPKIILLDNINKSYEANQTERIKDKFIYKFYFPTSTSIKKVKILSETIDALPDARVLSFPIKSLELKK